MSLPRSVLLRSSLFLALSAAASAQCTFTVTSTADDGSAGTLRSQIADAEAAACPSGALINFSLPASAPWTITLSSRILINASLTIAGPGASNLTISGNNATRIFFVGTGTTAPFSGAVNISGVTLANGFGLGGSAYGGGGAAGMGGAIFQNGGTLSISSAVFSGNAAQGGGNDINLGYGGGGFGGNAPPHDGGSGGDLGGLGGTTTSPNGGVGGGGAPSASVSPDGNGGFGGGGGGQGLQAGHGGFGGGGGGADVNFGNGGFGGGNGYGFGGGGAGLGGAIFAYTGSLSLTNTTFSGDQASGGSTFLGDGGGKGQGKGGALFIYTGATATGANVTFSGNSAGQAGVNSAGLLDYDGNPSGSSGSVLQCPGVDTVDVCGTLTLDTVTITAGNDQAAPLNAAFSPLTIQVTQGTTDVMGLPVTFTINANGGAGATFAGGVTTTTVNTDSSGNATVNLTGNGTAGSFTVTALGQTFNLANCVNAPVVSNSTDAVPPTANTLRWAVANACSGATITFSLAEPSAITLTDRILVNNSVTVQGPGASKLIISGNNATRIFFVGTGTLAPFSGTVNISGVTLANGLGLGGSSEMGGGAAGMGGAIFQNGGALDISNVVFSGNAAQGGGGDANLGNGGGGFGGDAPSGLIEVGGSGGDLGGLGGTPTSPNGGVGGGGAGIQDVGAGIQVGNGGFGGGGGGSDLTFGYGGFGGGFGSGGGGGGAGFGGAIFAYKGSLSLANTTFSDDQASGGSTYPDGGGAYGQGKGGALFIYTSATATGANVTFSGNSAAQAGVNTAGGYDYNGNRDDSAGAVLQCPGVDNVNVCGTLTIAPNLSVSKSAVGTFTQGKTAEWDVTVSNAAGSEGTNGTTTVFDQLPLGYTLNTLAAVGWSCIGDITSVTCTSTNAVAGGSSFPVIKLTVNVPANSPVSVTNTASAFGGGDPIHPNGTTAATGPSTVTVVQVPSTISTNGLSTQAATIGMAFGSLAVTVKDAGGAVIPNYSSVKFTATTGSNGQSGTFSNSTGTKTAGTNTSGVADPGTFTANGKVGVYSIGVTAGSATNGFNLTNTAGTPASMTAITGTTPQSATVNMAFTNALAVTVKDSFSNPVSGVNITFTAPPSGASGKFSNNSAVITVPTNSSGIASAPFTSNSTAGGPYTVTATASLLTTVNFSLTNTAGSAASMTANSGATPQSATVNMAFTNALAVTVKDSLSNPVSGVNVTFTAPSSGASGKFGNSTTTIMVATNASGVASVPFTANGTASGPYTVTAAATGLTTINFSLTNTPGSAASMSANSGTTPQSAAINTAFANALAVTVKDLFSNPVSGVIVTFTAPSSGASGKFSNNSAVITVPTNGLGIASATFTSNGAAGGPYTVTATASLLTTVHFSLTNTTTPTTVTNLTSTTANGSYTIGALIPINITFSKLVNVTGSPHLALNSGGTATYSSGSGTATLTFSYTVAAGQSSAKLDASSATALSLNGGTITDAASQPATLTLPASGATGSLGANKSIVIDTTAPTVVSYSVIFGSQAYNVIGSSRNRLPWQITGITVTFSKPIPTGNISSLGGVTATTFSGLGTSTLTWTINPVPLGALSTTLAGSGANALKDAAGNALAGGTGFAQTLKILEGDFDDDGVVNAQDFVLINNAISQAYNIFADINGDGLVNLTDVTVARGRNGTSLP